MHYIWTDNMLSIGGKYVPGVGRFNFRESQGLLTVGQHDLRIKRLINVVNEIRRFSKVVINAYMHIHLSKSRYS